MKSSGYLISSISEFASCMKYGKYYFNCRLSGFFLYIHRDASSIILYRYGIIRIYGYRYLITEACKSLIHSIINYLINHMMESGYGGGANIHSGSFSYCLKTLKYLYLGSIILIAVMAIIDLKALFHLLGFHLIIKILIVSFIIFSCHLILLCYLSVFNPEYFIDMKPVIYEVIQTGTGHEGLDLLY